MKLGLGTYGIARYRNVSGPTTAGGIAVMVLPHGLAAGAYVFGTIANAVGTAPTGLLYAPEDLRTPGVDAGSAGLRYQNTAEESTFFDALVINDVDSWNHFQRIQQGHWGVLAGRTVFANTTAAVTVPRLDAGAIILASLYGPAATVYPAETSHWVPRDERDSGAGTFNIESTQDITGAFAEWLVINDVEGLWDMQVAAG